MLSLGEQDGMTRRETLLRGGVAGVAAFGLGYVLTWVLAGNRASKLVVDGPFGGFVPNWRAVLWVFYDSHLVGTETPRIVGPGGDLWARGEIVNTVDALNVEFLYAVPVVLLLVAGAWVAAAVGASDARNGAIAGGAVAAGYLLAVVVGLFAAPDGGVAPNTLRALVVAGLVYPVAVGAVGGGVVGAVRRGTAGRRGVRAGQ